MATTPVSPKVKSAGAIGSIVGILLAYAAAVTPETFAFLGKWAQPAYLAVTLGSAVYAAYRTADPLRQAPADPAPATGGTDASASPAEAVSAALAQESKDAQRTPASTYPAAAVAAAEAAPAEVNPLVP